MEHADDMMSGALLDYGCRMRAVSAVSGDQYVCPFLFDFLTVREVGRAANVCQAWRTGAEDDELWRELYARTQVGEAGMEDWARALAARPFGEDAIGWEVEVYHEEDDTWRHGLVVEYADSHYRVEYPDGTRRWECEQRSQGPWHRRGNSRLFFVGRLHDSIAGVSGGAINTSSSSTSSSNNRSGDGGDAGACQTGTGVTPFLSSSSSTGPSSGGGDIWGRLRHGHWKKELKANASHVPAVELARLMHHTDEVLDLKFSPDGTRLATCSRDMSILVYSIEVEDENEEDETIKGVEGVVDERRGVEDAKGGDALEVSGVAWRGPRRQGYGRLSVRLIHRLRRSATASVCRIFWSPCSRFILSCLEDPQGNPFEPSSSELWDANLGQWLSRCRSQPFDVHAAWLPDGEHFVAGLDLDRDMSDVTAPFSQTLAIRRRPRLTPVMKSSKIMTAMEITETEEEEEENAETQVSSSPEASGTRAEGEWQAKEAEGKGEAEVVAGVMWVDPAMEEDNGVSTGRGVLDIFEGKSERASPGGEGGEHEAQGDDGVGSNNACQDTVIPFTFGEAAVAAVMVAMATNGREEVAETGPRAGGKQPQQQLLSEPQAMDVEDENDDGHHMCRSSSSGCNGGAGWGGLGSDGLNVDAEWMPNARVGGGTVGIGNGAIGNGSGTVSGGASGIGGGVEVVALNGELFNFGGAIPPVVEGHDHGNDAGGDEGGVQWVVEGSEAIHPTATDDAEMPLVGEIRLNLGRNFGHFFQMSSSGEWACIATGETPLMCHRIAFIPLRGPRLTSLPRSPSASSTTNAPSNAPSSSSNTEEDVFIRLVSGESAGVCGDIGGGGSGGEHPGSSGPAVARMETVECGGAVLSLSISRDDRFAMANVRPFADGALERLQNPPHMFVAPDIMNAVELQVWDVETKTLLFKLGGHHAFTTKDCPFLIFAEQSTADPFGDYVASGSEEHCVFVWHLRHRLLLRSLKKHTNVVNSVSWNPKIPGMLASCSDDWTAIIWGPKVRRK